MAVTLGLGTCESLDTLTVKFPGGEKRTFKKVAADGFYRVVEGKGIQKVDGVYGRAEASVAAPAAPTAPVVDAQSRLGKLAANAPGHAPLVLVDLFATWCDACVRTAPRLDALVAGAGDDKLDVVTVTVEPTDDAAALSRYHDAHPTMRMASPYDAVLVDEVATRFGVTPPLPSTMIIERKTGRVVLQTHGTPTRSDIERVLWQHP
jgi:thiol-disulfide isomerase/thioredoxin